jgi:tocopherol O-methyltransferase
MHHGYYPPRGEKGASSSSSQQQPLDDTQAQVDMIDRVLEWAGVIGGGPDGATSSPSSSSSPPPKTMIDIGCGVGGSSRHVARLFPELKTEGVTLSPFQAQRAQRLSERAGLGDRCRFRVADALDAPFADGSFDLVWSLESGEHMPGKPKFVKELARLCAPGGRVIVVTWCHRNLLPGETALRPEEQALLDRICEAYYLPPWCPPSEYAELMAAEGLEEIKTADWSEAVAPFWGAVIRKALTPRGVAGLFGAGWQTIKGAVVMPLMARGLAMGTVRFALVTAVKPKA